MRRGRWSVTHVTQTEQGRTDGLARARLSTFDSMIIMRPTGFGQRRNVNNFRYTNTRKYGNISFQYTYCALKHSSPARLRVDLMVHGADGRLAGMEVMARLLDYCQRLRISCHQFFLNFYTYNKSPRFILSHFYISSSLTTTKRIRNLAWSSEICILRRTTVDFFKNVHDVCRLPYYWPIHWPNIVPYILQLTSQHCGANWTGNDALYEKALRLMQRERSANQAGKLVDDREPDNLYTPTPTNTRAYIYIYIYIYVYIYTHATRFTMPLLAGNWPCSRS